MTVLGSLSTHARERLRVASAVMHAVDPLDPSAWTLQAHRDRYQATAELVRVSLQGLLARGQPSADDADRLYKLWWWRDRLSPGARRRCLAGLKLPSPYHERALSVMDAFAARARSRGDADGSLGCWGTGQGSIEHILESPGALAWYFNLLTEVSQAGDRDRAYDCVRRAALSEVPGLQKGILSPTLYCLRPTDFPVLNGPVRDTLREVLNVKCAQGFHDYVDWAADMVDLNAQLGLDPDFWEFDRLWYRHLPMYADRGESLLELDRTFLRVVREVALPDTARFYEASQCLEVWKDVEDEAADFREGVRKLADVMAALRGEPSADGAMEQLQRAGQPPRLLWETIGDASNWSWPGQDPWPVALDRLIGWYGAEVSSDILYAADPDGEYGCYRDGWLQALQKSGIAFAESDGRFDCESALGDTDLQAEDRHRIVMRAGSFLANAVSCGVLIARYGAYGPRALVLLPALLGQR